MFKVVANPVVTWPVEVQHQVDGKDVEETFTATFELLADEDVEKLFEQDGSLKALLRRVVKGWADLADGEGKPLAFSAEALDLFMAIGFRRMALFRAYQRAALGVREKN